jgi:hypothetical protein
MAVLKNVFDCIFFNNGSTAALVDLLLAKSKSWEEERKKVFLYDEVDILLLVLYSDKICFPMIA